MAYLDFANQDVWAGDPTDEPGGGRGQAPQQLGEELHGNAGANAGSSTPTGGPTQGIPEGSPEHQAMLAGDDPTGFVNLSTILNANVGRGALMAKPLTDKISAEANAAQTAGEQGYAEFNDAVDKGTYQRPDDVQSSNGTRLAGRAVYGDDGQVMDAVNVPGTHAAQPDDNTGVYGGPDNFQQYMGNRWGDIANEAADARQGIDRLGDESGRDVLLDDQFGKNSDYSRGNRTMDNWLLTGEAGAAHDRLDSQFKNLGNMLSDWQTAGTARVGAARDASKATGDQQQADWNDWTNTQHQAAANNVERRNQARRTRISYRNDPTGRGP